MNLFKLVSFGVITILIAGCGSSPQVVKYKPVVVNKPVYNANSLIRAALNENVNLMSLHFDNNVDVNTVDSDGNSLVHIAVKFNNQEMLNLLIEKSANLNRLNDQRMTPLHMAVSNKSLEIINTLLNQKVLANTKNNDGNAPIHTATIDNSEGIIKSLINYDMSCILSIDKNGYTPLILSTDLQNANLVELFLKNRADVNAKSNEDLIALQYSVTKPSLEITKILLKYASPLTILTNEQQSLLHLSVINNIPETTKFLVSHGLSTTLKDNTGYYALNYAIEYSDYAMIDFLLKSYSAFDNSSKFDFLKQSINKNSPELLLALYSGGISLSTLEPKTKSTVLHYAVSQEEQEDMLKAILKKNASLVESTDSKGITAIEYTIKDEKFSYEEILKPYFIDAKMQHIKDDYKFAKLKSLYLKYPEMINRLNNELYIISLDGPEELMIGDIKVIHDSKRSIKIITSQIKRLKVPYSDFNSHEINTLLRLGLPPIIVAEILDVTTSLNKQAMDKEELKLSQKIQALLLDSTNKSLEAQNKLTEIQEKNSQLTLQVIKNQETLIEAQKLTVQTLKTNAPAAAAASGGVGSAIAETATKEIASQLLRQFF